MGISVCLCVCVWRQRQSINLSACAALCNSFVLCAEFPDRKRPPKRPIAFPISFYAHIHTHTRTRTHTHSHTCRQCCAHYDYSPPTPNAQLPEGQENNNKNCNSFALSTPGGVLSLCVVVCVCVLLCAMFAIKCASNKRQQQNGLIKMGCKRHETKKTTK